MPHIIRFRQLKTKRRALKLVINLNIVKKNLEGRKMEVKKKCDLDPLINKQKLRTP